MVLAWLKNERKREEIWISPLIGLATVYRDVKAVFRCKQYSRMTVSELSTLWQACSVSTGMYTCHT